MASVLENACPIYETSDSGLTDAIYYTSDGMVKLMFRDKRSRDKALAHYCQRCIFHQRNICIPRKVATGGSADAYLDLDFTIPAVSLSSLFPDIDISSIRLIEVE